MNEIGGEFWFDPRNAGITTGRIPNFLTEKFPEANHDYFFTSSGRSACCLLLQHVKPKKMSVLLPEYTCETVIAPFVNAGYHLHFYEVECDLNIDIEKWRLQYRNTQPGVVLLHPYFGLDTISCVREKYDEIKSDHCIVMEDVTHSLLSRYPVTVEPDYYLGSLRKWMGIPDGGFLIDCSKKTSIISPKECDDFFVNTRIEALALKNRYIQDCHSVMKEDFLALFAKAENHLDHSFETKAMSKISLSIMENANWYDTCRQRQSNYLFLEEQLKNFDPLLSPVFGSLPECVCPLFMPVRVKTDRHRLRAHFIHHQIYPPIHWPLSKHVTESDLTRVHEIYHHCLSIPCDQRYLQQDLHRIIDVLGKFK